VVDGPFLKCWVDPSPVVVMDFHVEGPGSSGNDLTDPAIADNAKPLAGHLDANHKTGAPVAPLFRANQTLSLAGPAGRPEHQQDGEFRRGSGEDIWGVGHDQTPLFAAAMSTWS
jgi:hypothetical protein